MTTHKLLGLGALIAALSLAGCADYGTETATSAANGNGKTTSSEAADGESTGTASSPAEAQPVTADEVQNEFEDAADTTRQLTMQKKDEYLQALDKQLEALDQQIAELKQKSAELGEGAKQRWNDSLADLEQKRQQYQQKYDEMTSASGDAWQELQGGIEAAWSDLKAAVDDAAKHFQGGGGENSK